MTTHSNANFRAHAKRAWQNRATQSLALLIAVTTACRQEQAKAPQKSVVCVAMAESLDATKGQARSEYIAILRGDVETELSFKVPGVLEILGRTNDTRDWQEGVRVTKGEVLARLKQEDFISSLKSARAKAELDRQQFERNVKLRDSGAVSQQELEAASAARLASEAALSQAEQALHDSVLVAPHDGVIAARLANSRETIASGKPVVKLADLRQMSVELGVPDRLISRVRVGKEFPVRVNTLEGQTFLGKVSEVGVAAKEGARLFRVVIKVPNREGLLKSGMTASVSLEEDKVCPAGSVLIPMSALVSASGSAGANRLSVFVVSSDGKAREQTVETDDLIRSSVVVTAGLKAGDMVVTTGASTLFDGAPIDTRHTEKP